MALSIHYKSDKTLLGHYVNNRTKFKNNKSMNYQDIQSPSLINDMISDIKKNVITPYPKGFAVNAADFFNQMIKWQFQNKATIQAIHKALLEYVKNPDAVYAIRLYGSEPKEKYHLLRRGFLSEYKNGLKTFFCDNTFAMPFAALKLHGKCYTASDLLEHLNQKNVVCGFGSTTEERELAYYRCNSYSRINLNTSGWYLAHILPVGYDFVGEQRLSEVFPNPERTEWELDASHIRHINRLLTDEEYSILVAHFLRLIHPLNSFVVPKKDRVDYAGKSLGEEQELINIVQDYVEAEFPKEYAELKMVMQIPEQKEAVNVVGEIVWSASKPQTKETREEIFEGHHLKGALKKRSKRMDQYDDDKAYALDGRLNSIGKKTFLNLYNWVRHNIDITIDEIEEVYPKYKNKAEGAKKTCLSSTRSIIRNGYAAEALEIIIESPRMDDAAIQTAKEYLKELCECG